MVMYCNIGQASAVACAVWSFFIDDNSKNEIEKGFVRIREADASVLIHSHSESVYVNVLLFFFFNVRHFVPTHNKHECTRTHKYMHTMCLYNALYVLYVPVKYIRKMIQTYF